MLDKMTHTEIKEQTKESVKDLVTNLTYYDRVKDEELTRKVFDDAIEDGIISVKEMVDTFKKELIKQLNA